MGKLKVHSFLQPKIPKKPPIKLLNPNVHYPRHIFATDWQWGAIQQRAREQGVSVSEWVRFAATHCVLTFKKQESPSAKKVRGICVSNKFWEFMRQQAASNQCTIADWIIFSGMNCIADESDHVE